MKNNNYTNQVYKVDTDKIMKAIAITANYEQLHLSEAIDLCVDIYRDEVTQEHKDIADELTKLFKERMVILAHYMIGGGWNDNGYGEGCYHYYMTKEREYV